MSNFLREAPTLTIPDVLERLDVSGETLSARSSQIEVHLTAETPNFRIKDREVPATPQGIKSLGARLGVPTKFLMDDCPEDLQETILSRLLQTSAAADVHQIRVNDNYGILDVRSQASKWIDPRRLVEVAGRVVDPAAPVLNFWNGGVGNNEEFRLDVLVPDNFDRGVGGDPAVGDLTKGGIRITQNIKQGDQFHAPAVSLLMYRLVCTNGMESVNLSGGDRIEARNNSVEEVLAQFEEIADRTFKRAEEEIASFYAMRGEAVDNPEQTLIRMAQEHDIPRGMRLSLVERLPGMELANPDFGVSMFDITNLITNAANDPALRRAGGRRTLERVGGRLIGDHTARCQTCRSRLN